MVITRPSSFESERLILTESDGDLICQSGARWEQINDTLKEKGIPLFFPVSIILYYSVGNWLKFDSWTPDQAP